MSKNKNPSLYAIGLTLVMIATLFGLEAQAAITPSHTLPQTNPADAADAWWDDGWPYRIPVTVSGEGIAQVAIDFTAAFNNLGLNHALLDLRSVRVVPYTGAAPGAPLPCA